MLKNIKNRASQPGKQIKLLISAAALCCAFTNTAQAIPYSQISQVYFFGDSLTDSGFNNLFPEPVLVPGKARTFTTWQGYTWSQYVAHNVKGFDLPVYGTMSPVADTITNNEIFSVYNPVPSIVSPILDGVDYACGGATTDSPAAPPISWAPSVHAQIEYFLDTHPGQLDPKAVFFIWAGANDILNAFGTDPSPANLILTANNAAMNIAKDVARLSRHGAKRIVILSLPNLGVTPLIQEAAVMEGDPTLPATAQSLTFTFNSMLNQKLGEVILTHRVKVLYVNVYTLLDNVIKSTQAGKPYVVAGQPFTFVNYTDPICSGSSLVCTVTSQDYIFADSIHPTGEAHRLLSLYVEEQLKAWA
ncbi:MAG: SGNH/GDSL hydrolase family protein [Legionella sp.]